MKRLGPLLLLALGACASAEPVPTGPATPPPLSDRPTSLGDPEKSMSVDEAIQLATADLAAADLGFDFVITFLRYHWSLHPESAALNSLLAQAHARVVDTLDLKNPTERPRYEEHRQAGLFHANESLRRVPDSGSARYWYAMLLLQTADVEQSYSRLKDALLELDQAEKLMPSVDDGGPARMKGRVYQETPGFLLGSLTKAISCYEKSLQISPRRMITHLWLAETYSAAGQPDAARKEIAWVLAQKDLKPQERANREIQKQAQQLIQKVNDRWGPPGSRPLR